MHFIARKGNKEKHTIIHKQSVKYILSAECNINVTTVAKYEGFPLMPLSRSSSGTRQH